jgi:hypothetical protein
MRLWHKPYVRHIDGRYRAAQLPGDAGLIQWQGSSESDPAGTSQILNPFN